MSCSTPRKVCLYHKDCLDGTAAAWAVLCKYPDIECIPVSYHDPIPDGLSGCDVIMVDFCYKLPVMKDLLDRVNAMLVIDHHEPTGRLINALQDYAAGKRKRFEIVFDTQRSGCQLTWAYFHRKGITPSPIQHVGDADTWSFKYPGTRMIVYGLSAIPQDPNVWCERLQPYFTSRGFSNTKFNKVYTQHGQIIAPYLTEQHKRIIKQTMRLICMNNLFVPMVNCPRSMASEILEMLYQEYPFAVSYFDTDSHRIFSLRSNSHTASPVRVNDIASVFGGNGHPCSAGFAVPREHRLARM